MSKVILGEFIFDTSNNLLFFGEKELEAEPKVLELLAYLQEHRDRYISLQELHEQVWCGRVVSDTAVRGTIKKLRNLLDDVDITEPKYIKSISKRGYKLICDVSAYPDLLILDSTVPPSVDINPTIWDVSGGHTSVCEQPKMAFTLPFNTISVVLSLFLCVIIIGFILLWQQGKPEPSSDENWRDSAELISTIVGEKRGLALSPDGKYLGFIGRQNSTGAWGIYLMHRQTGNLQRVHVNIQQPSAIQFYDDKTLFIVDEVFGHSGIHRIILDDAFKVQQQERMQDFFLITSIQRSSEINEWLVSAVKSAQGTVKLYKWDVKSNTLELLDALSSPLDHLYDAAFSPDGRWVVKAQLINASDYHLTIQRENKPTFSKKTIGLIKKMLWLDEVSLLVLDQQHLSVINLLDNSEKILLDAKESGLSDIVFDQTQQRLLGLYQPIAAKRIFRELDLKKNSSFERIINTPEDSRVIHYTEHDAKFFSVIKNKNNYKLIQFDQRSGKEKLLFSSELYSELLDYHFTQGVLLLKVGEQLLLVTPTTGNVQIVTNSQALLDHHASFSTDGQRVYFGQYIGGVWELHQFDRVSQRVSLLVRGYSSVREARDGFIVATSSGELLQLDHELVVVRSLGYNINTEKISRWYVRKQQIVWSDFDFITTTINQLDLDSGKLQQYSSPYAKLFPRFVLNQDASRMLVYGLDEINSELRASKLPPLPHLFTSN